MSDEVREQVLLNIRRRLTPQPHRIRADIEVTCFAYDGVLAIREALVAGSELHSEEKPLSIKLIAPPLFVLFTQSVEKEAGIAHLQRAIDLIKVRAPATAGGGRSVRGGRGGARWRTDLTRPGAAAAFPPQEKIEARGGALNIKMAVRARAARRVGGGRPHAPPCPLDARCCSARSPARPASATTPSCRCSWRSWRPRTGKSTATTTATIELGCSAPLPSRRPPSGARHQVLAPQTARFRGRGVATPPKGPPRRLVRAGSLSASLSGCSYSSLLWLFCWPWPPWPICGVARRRHGGRTRRLRQSVRWRRRARRLALSHRRSPSPQWTITRVSHKSSKRCGERGWRAATSSSGSTSRSPTPGPARRPLRGAHCTTLTPTASL